MRKGLYFKLFGTAQIVLDGEVVLFSFAKINALLYYLLVHQMVSRDEIAGLLWENKSEKVAKKNLRNTIYQANKILGAEYIISPNKTILTFNTDLLVRSDVSLFMSDSAQHLDQYQGEFLKGFFLKDSELFELWIEKMRRTYEQRFVQYCYQKIEHNIQTNQAHDVEKYIKRLIAIDEFDERNYQLLMRYYQDNHRYGKVIETYYELSNALEQELGIAPSEETRALYDQTLSIVNQKKARETLIEATVFLGRTNEIEQLENHFRNFQQEHTQQSVVLVGETGSGKTLLSRKVIDNVWDRFHVIEVRAIAAEQQFPLRIWKRVIEKIDKYLDVQNQPELAQWQQVIYRYFPSLVAQGKTYQKKSNTDLNELSQVLIRLLRTLSQDKPVVLFIEDIQWLDKESLLLLSDCLWHCRSQVMALMTLRQEYQVALNEPLLQLYHQQLLLQVHLRPFTLEEVKEYVVKQASELTVSAELIQQLYEETEGNPLFLSEAIGLLKSNMNLDTLSSKMQTIFKLQYTSLTTIEKEIVKTMSYFDRYTPLTVLTEMVQQSSIQLVAALDALVAKCMIVEQPLESEVSYAFVHRKFKTYIYTNQSVAKRRTQHQHIAQSLEAMFKQNEQNYHLLADIAHHYREAKQALPALEYQVAYLQRHLQLQHEIFPIYSQTVYKRDRLYELDHLSIMNRLEQLKQAIIQLEDKYADNALYQLLIVRFLYLEGRYFIRCGKYREGIENIQRVIVKAKQVDSREYVLEGYRQMVYYYIQINQPDEMFYYIELGLEEAIESNQYANVGVFLRLKGLHFLMKGDLQTAESLCKESITTLTITESLKEKYRINIAAAYDYLAEIAKIKGDYERAIQLQKQAIDISEMTTSYSTLVVLYINMGMILYAQADYAHAKDYFIKADTIYDHLSIMWKEVQLKVYQVLIALQEKDYVTIMHFVMNAESYLNKFANPRDMGMVQFIKAVLKYSLNPEVPKEREILRVLTRSGMDYYQEAVKNLSRHRDGFELRMLKRLYEET